MSTLTSTLESQVLLMVQEPTDYGSGFWTQAEFLKYVNEIEMDFNHRTGIRKKVDAVTVVAGQRLYDNPTDAMTVHRISYNDLPLDKTTERDLNFEYRRWREWTGSPRQYHMDKIAIEKFEVDRKPTASNLANAYSNVGTYGGLRSMSGSNTYVVSSGDYGLLRTMSGSVYRVNPLPSQYGTLRNMVAGEEGFEVVYTMKGTAISSTGTNLFTHDAFVIFIKYGVLWKMLSKQGEGQDLFKAEYCKQRYEFGIALAERLVNMGVLKNG